MAEPSTIYKLMVLCLLSESKEPLSNAVISDFFLDKGYTSYFNIQQELGSLEESALIRREETSHHILYQLTEDGRETLRYLSDKLNTDIISDIREFLGIKRPEITEENDFRADWSMDHDGHCFVHLSHRQKGQLILELTLAVPSREAAEAACLNWRQQQEPVQEVLYDLLIK